MIDSRLLFFLITIFTSQFSLAGQFKDTYNLNRANMGDGQLVEMLFRQARDVLPGMQFRYIGHDVAVLFYLVRRHVNIEPDLLADVLDAIPLRQRRPEHQESWGAMLCRGLLNLIPRWPRSDPMVPFIHGGSLQMLTAFTSRRSTGYAREAGGCGIFVTPLSAGPHYTRRSELYAMRTPLYFFGTPCVANGKIPESCLRKVNHNDHYERVIMPEDAQKIVDLCITELDLADFELVQYSLDRFFMPPNSLRVLDESLRTRILVVLRNIAQVFGLKPWM